MIRNLFLSFAVAMFSAGCAMYNYASNVKTVSFSDDLSKGHSIGNVHGEDCTWNILGIQLGGFPTLDRAFEHLRNQTDGGSLSGSMDSHQVSNGGALRYINNVSTKQDGFNAVIVGKNCIVARGVGYK